MADYGNAGVQSRAKPQGRANVLQLKLIGQSHSTGLTANLLRLFEPRAPLEYKPPVEKRKLPAYSGIAQFVRSSLSPGTQSSPLPLPRARLELKKRPESDNLSLNRVQPKLLKSFRIMTRKVTPMRLEIHTKHSLLQDLVMRHPSIGLKGSLKLMDLLKGIYVSGEIFLKEQRKSFASAKGSKVRLVTDKETKKPRGYAFVEYAHTRDMKNAYKQADGRKLDNKRVLVDVERGRTVPNWRPRRLGGGLGSSRIGGEGADHKRAAREQQLAWRPRSEEPRRDDRHADRDREKSHERVQGRDRDGRTRERLHDQTRDRESREERHNHRDRDRTWDKDQERDRERDRGRDRHDRDKHRDHGREREHGRSHDCRRDRGKDRENGDPRHERNMADYDLDYGYNQPV